MIARSLIEFHHDTGYGDHLLKHINDAIRGKDMQAVSVITNTPYPNPEVPEGQHPVQRPYRQEQSRCSTKVTTAAYEVYRALYGPQEALMTGWCRGGFGTGELIAFLYARAFPREQWRQRVDEAFKGMENL